MTIERGRQWGQRGALPVGGVVVHSDGEARAIVERARRAEQAVPTLGLAGGDLCRTVGGRGDESRLRSADGMLLPVDVGAVLLDGRLHWFVAHLVARTSWWRGPLFAAMNAQWLGRWNLAPRAHPNDGLLDTFCARLSFDDRLKASARLRSGTHVPHPGISEGRVRSISWDFERPLDVWLDGDRLGRARRVSIRVEPDALLCAV